MVFLVIILCILTYSLIASIVGMTFYKTVPKRCHRCKRGYCSRDHETPAVFFGIFWPLTLLAAVLLKTGDAISTRIVERDTLRERREKRKKAAKEEKERIKDIEHKRDMEKLNASNRNIELSIRLCEQEGIKARVKDLTDAS